MPDKQRLVVVGNGMAGARAVEEILARGGGEQFAITMFGDEPYGNYNRILLSNVLNGLQLPQDIFLNPLSWYQENDVTLHAPSRVTRIDRYAHTVTAGDGLSVDYDKLLMATGSRPFVPPMEGLRAPDGADKHGVFVFRTIDDCHRIAGYATKCRRAAVIGGGLLGLEAARGLLKYGAEVHVIHISGHLMNQQLDKTAGMLLKVAMEKMGVHVHTNKATVRVLGDDSVTGLEFKDGTTLDCDMVVISTGVRPNTELALECGLTVERAIVTDDQMRSVDDPDVYVVGECAQHRNRVYGLVAPLWEMGAVLADHITGRNPSAAYHGSKIATKLKVMGVALASMGVTEPELDTDEVVLFTESRRGIYQKMILRDDVLIGAILLGDTEKAAFLTQAFDRGMPLDEDRRGVLFDPAPAKSSPEDKLLTMPDDAKVCNCLGLTKGAIRKCVEGGNRTLAMVQQDCRAGTGCGSCKPLVQDIITWVTGGLVEEETGDDQKPVLPLCFCNNVSADQVRSCVAQGRATVEAVMGATGAGAGCGACKQEIQKMIGPSPTPRPPASPLFGGISFGSPEVTGAVKVLVRELVRWACSDEA